MYHIYLLSFILIILGVWVRSIIISCHPIFQSQRTLDGKTIIITGGTTGIGLEIATDFAVRGARVIIACPFDKEGQDALQHIVNKSANKRVTFKLLDLCSIRSIRKFTDEIIKSEENLHILVNNAGVFTPEYITKDGMNCVMQTNYFGHFLLTLLLLPLLKKTGRTSAPSRIINVTSQIHYIGNIDFRKLNNIINWPSCQTYANSKLCLALFTRELAKRLKNSNVVVNSADPGYAATYIVKFHNIIFKITLYLLIKILLVLGFKTPRRGARTAIYVAIDQDAATVSGEMFYNCKLTKAAKMAYDDGLARNLWNESIKLVKLERQEICC